MRRQYKDPETRKIKAYIRHRTYCLKDRGNPDTWLVESLRIETDMGEGWFNRVEPALYSVYASLSDGLRNRVL